MFSGLLNLFSDGTVLTTLKFVFRLLFVIVPVGLLAILWDLWVQYVQALFFAKTETILLEIKLPREIFKSPKAMEFCINSLHSTLGEGNWFEKYWKGQVRIHHSLEIVSTDGVVHFYIWTRKGEKNKIEANLYSQYPGIEIFEVPDYTLPVSYDPELHGMWMTEFELVKPDPFPIKTYIDYGLDKDPDEEFKIDPMTPLIEFLGSLSRGNNAWIQIIIRAHTKEETDPKKLSEALAAAAGELSLKKFFDNWEKQDLRWAKGSAAEVKKIMDDAKGVKDGVPVPGTGRPLTKDEQNIIESLNRSVSKKGFDTGIRVIYTAPKDIFSMGNVGGIVGGIMHFNSDSGLNGFKPYGTTSPNYKHPFLVWKARSAKLLNAERQDFLDAYKRRAYFHKPFKRDKYFILNTEELATLFHLPGGVSATPTFARVDSRKMDAPSNLPV
jgi:hypothetical protein